MSDDTKLKLYGVPVSQPVRAVMWACLAKGLPFDFEMTMPGARKGTRSEAFRKINPYGLFGWAAIFGQVTPGALTAAARLGLWDPPPVNLFTDISNAAMEAGIAEGSVPKWRATMWAQDYWKDLIGQYYANGESAAFLTKAGGVCAEHADWCAGLTLPP